MEEQTLSLGEAIKQALNELFSNLFSSIDNSIYSLLDNITFIDTKITTEPAITKLLGDNISNGFLLICNALLIGFILYYAINFLFSHLTYSRIQRPSQFIFKCIIFVALMNSSLWICNQIINIISIVTDIIKSLGNSAFGSSISFSSLIDKINSTIYVSGSEFNLVSFDGIIKSFSTIGLINLLFTYSLRYIMIQVFILISPFAFLCLIMDNTEWFFKSWLRNFLSLLLVQILISIILCLSFSFNLDGHSNLSKLLFIGIIYALTRSNTFMKEIIGGISTDVSTGLSSIKNLSI